MPQYFFSPTNLELIDNVDVEADLKWRMEREPDKTGLFEDEYEYEQLSRDKPLVSKLVIRFIYMYSPREYT